MAVTPHPNTLPSKLNHGEETKKLSPATPRSAPPIVGTNILHVVSATLRISKAVEDLGGVVMSRTFLCDTFIYVYTIAGE